MKSFNYHAFKDSNTSGFDACSRASDAAPLMINCTGLMTLSHRFTSYNERGREDYYLMYVVEGALTVGTPCGDRRAEVGDFVLFPPHYPYKYTFSGEGSISYYFVHFTGSYAQGLLDALSLAPLPYIGRAGFSESVSRTISSIFDLYAREDPLREVKSSALLQTVLATLAGKTRGGGGRSRLKRSLPYINAFYTENISVPELAAMENLSVSRYNALFREIVGSSPIRYITELRMNQACSLLATTDLDIGTIGQAVGYEDKHFFSKTFKRHIGVPASEYRKNKSGL